MLSKRAFESLYGELERPLFNIALRHTWVESAAMDLVHDAFMKLWTRRLLIREATASAWLFKCVLNLGRSYARRRGVWNRIEPLVEDASDPAMTPDQVVSEGQLRAALERMPDDLREVLLLLEFGGLKQREVAALLRIPIGTVGSRKHAAMTKLKEEITR